MEEGPLCPFPFPLPPPLPPPPCPGGAGGGGGGGGGGEPLGAPPLEPPESPSPLEGSCLVKADVPATFECGLVGSSKKGSAPGPGCSPRRWASSCRRQVGQPVAASSSRCSSIPRLSRLKIIQSTPVPMVAMLPVTQAMKVANQAILTAFLETCAALMASSKMLSALTAMSSALASACVASTKTSSSLTERFPWVPFWVKAVRGARLLPEEDVQAFNRSVSCVRPRKEADEQRDPELFEAVAVVVVPRKS
mmetsp:Transcript_88768/g.185584  ORF Transcript_88768/g.185584 Transcript_88768/m.185584 type:complete len:250 (+) Transcript_88768:119-868(+)